MDDEIVGVRKVVCCAPPGSVFAVAEREECDGEGEFDKQEGGANAAAGEDRFSGWYI